jgi:hypothetical protein
MLKFCKATVEHKCNMFAKLELSEKQALEKNIVPMILALNIKEEGHSNPRSRHIYLRAAVIKPTGNRVAYKLVNSEGAIRID